MTETSIVHYADYEWTQVHESGLYKYYHQGFPGGLKNIQSKAKFHLLKHFVKSLAPTQLQRWKL